MLIRLVWVGRTRAEPLALLVEDYRKRIARFCPIDIVSVKDAAGEGKARSAREARELRGKIEGRGLVLALDPGGDAMNSPEFARFLEKSLSARPEISFVLGGPDGIGSEVLEIVEKRISLSRLTFSHEMARVILLEQIYRAFGIMRGTPYHR